MEYGAIDLHLKASLIRIVDAEGVVVVDRTVATTRAALTQVFAGRAPLRVLVESGTESEWVAQTLEACGHVGDRGGSNLRADVWASRATDENGQTGCGRTGRGVPPGDLPRGVPRVGGAARGPAGGPHSGATGAHADADDQSTARAAPAGGDPVGC